MGGAAGAPINGPDGSNVDDTGTKSFDISTELGKENKIDGPAMKSRSPQISKKRSRNSYPGLQNNDSKLLSPSSTPTTRTDTWEFSIAPSQRNNDKPPLSQEKALAAHTQRKNVDLFVKNAHDAEDLQVGILTCSPGNKGSPRRSFKASYEHSPDQNALRRKTSLLSHTLLSMSLSEEISGGFTDVDKGPRSISRTALKESPHVAKMLRRALQSHFLFSELGGDCINVEMLPMLKRVLVRQSAQQLARRNEETAAHLQWYQESLKAVEDTVDGETAESKKSVLRRAYHERMSHTWQHVEVVTQGLEANHFYIITRGMLGVFVDEMQRRTLGPGDTFGEVALMFNTERTATIRSCSPETEMWQLGRDDFKACQRKIRSSKLMDRERMLQRVPLLKKLPPTSLAQLSEILIAQVYGPDDVIVRQGEEAGCFYLIEEGRVKVSRDGVEVGEKAAGDHFGAEAIMNNHARDADMVALSDVKVLAVLRSDFVRLFGTVFSDIKKDIKLMRRRDKMIFSEKVSALRSVRLKDVHPVHKIGEGGFGVVMLCRLGDETQDLQDTQDSKARTGQRQVVRIASTRYSKQAQRLPKHLARQRTVLSATGRRPKEFGMLNNSTTTAKAFTVEALFALKAMSKATIYKHGSNYCYFVVDEKRLLQRLCHPFIVKLITTMSNKNSLFMLYEYCAGGDLRRILDRRMRRANRGLQGKCARVAIASVLDALSYLHSWRLVYRDMKLDNIVTTSKGQIKLIDFTMCKEVPARTFTTLGTPEYMAPEMILGKGYNHSIDYWGLGVCLFMLILGREPFSGDGGNKAGMSSLFRRILTKDVQIANKVKDASLRNLIQGLLAKKPDERLGSSIKGADDIKDHIWFSDAKHDLDWDLLRENEFPNGGLTRSPFAISIKETERIMVLATKRRRNRWSGAKIDTSYYNPDPYKSRGFQFESLWDSEFTN